MRPPVVGVIRRCPRIGPSGEWATWNRAARVARMIGQRQSRQDDLHGGRIGQRIAPLFAGRTWCRLRKR